jgi:hypothetical protein
MMRELLRRVVGIGPPFFSPEQAVERARTELRWRGLSEYAEVRVTEGMRAYFIRFGSTRTKPGGPLVEIHVVTGGVVSFRLSRK